MMDITTLRTILSNRGDLSEWKLIEQNVSKIERYYIGRECECSRQVDTTDLTLWAFVDYDRDGKPVRGRASILIGVSFDEEEANAAIDRAVETAYKTHNPPFRLPAGERIEGSKPTWDTVAAIDALEKAVLSSSVPGATLNSLELFSSSVRKRVMSSNGAECESSHYSGYIEMIAAAGKPGSEVETYDALSFSEPDEERLSAFANTLLVRALDRSRAKPLGSDAKGLPVLLGGTNATGIFSWFFSNISTPRIYNKISEYSTGKHIQGGESAESMCAQAITMFAESRIAGHPASCDFDDDGIRLARKAVIERGVVRDMVGPVPYSSYLGLPPAGNYKLFSVEPGETAKAQLMLEPYFEPVIFSSFFVDSDTGDFGGEVRLGYVFDGKERIPVSGGSITGTVRKNRAGMKFSRERELAGNALVPSALLLPDVTVCPAE